MMDVPNNGQAREDWDAYYLEVNRRTQALAATRAAWVRVAEDDPASTEWAADLERAR